MIDIVSCYRPLPQIGARDFSIAGINYISPDRELRARARGFYQMRFTRASSLPARPLPYPTLSSALPAARLK